MDMLPITTSPKDELFSGKEKEYLFAKHIQQIKTQ